MVRYGSFENFHLLWLVLGMAAVMTYGIWRRGRALSLFVGAGSVERLVPRLSRPRQYLKATFIVMALTLVVIAMTQPQWGQYLAVRQARGRDILVALDVSRSMLADDVVPNRLDRAKADILDLVAAVEQTGGYRLGLIAFSGTTSVKCPLTQVTSYFKLALDGLDTDSVARAGTMIGDCIRAAIDAFDDKTQNFRDLVLISDGEDMDSFPLEAAARARESGVTIYTIGLGDPVQGARIPETDEAGRRSFVEYQGEIVWTRLHEEVLREIADQTGGIYVPAGTRAIELDQIFREVIEPKATRELSERRLERQRHRFQWFLAPAVLLLLVECLMREARRAPAAPGSAGSRASRARQSVLPLFVLAAFGWSPTAGAAEDARAIVQEGNRLYQQRKFEEASERYQQAASLAPDSPVPLHNQAAALFQTRQFNEAVRLYKQAREQADWELRQQINYALGNCHLQQAIELSAQPDLALQHARQAVQFYRDAIRAKLQSPRAEQTNYRARYNLELAKHLMRKLQQQQQQQGRQSERPENKGTEGEAQPRQNQTQQPDSKGDNSSADLEQQPKGSERPTEAGRRPSKEQLTPEEAAERLRAALARARMARSRRLRQDQKPVKVPAGTRDW